MQTYTFIGSDKNAGKTTAMNYVYHELLQIKPASCKICMTSIGINGEPLDNFDSREKPDIVLEKDTLFMTAAEHLNGLTGLYEIIDTISDPRLAKPYVFGRSLEKLKIVLEGPNDKFGIQLAKNIFKDHNKRTICLIDGSIDRQFIGHPTISDGIFYSLLVTDRLEQQSKLEDCLFATTLPEADQTTKLRIKEHKEKALKSLLMDEKGRVIYKGYVVPFLDVVLKEQIRFSAKEKTLLYLEGALSRTLHDFLAPFRHLTVVLDSFTRYLNISTETALRKVFKPKLILFHAIPIICFFLNQDSDHYRPELSSGIPIIDLFGKIPSKGLFKKIARDYKLFQSAERNERHSH